MARRVGVGCLSDVFTIYAYDPNTNTKLTELPGVGITFGSRLNDQGGFSFGLPLGRAGMAALVQPLLDYAGRPVKIYFDRDGVIQGGAYIAWTGAFTKSDGMLAIGGKEIASYFAQRVTVADYSEATYPAPGLDPAALLYKVYTDAQNPALAGAGASIGLSVVNASAGLSAIIPGYPLAQYTFSQQIALDLADIIQPGVGGLDVTVASAWNPSTGIPEDVLTLWTPRAGQSAGDSGVIFDLDSAIDYTWPTDATLSGTTIIATGAGNGEGMPVAQVNAPGVPVGGLGQSPRLDKVVSTSSQSQDQVSLMATGLAQQYGNPVATPTVVIPTAGPQPLGSWTVGDDARLYTVGDERFPTGLSQYWRIVQQEVNVPDEGVPTVTLTFNIPPIY